MLILSKTSALYYQKSFMYRFFADHKKIFILLVALLALAALGLDFITVGAMLLTLFIHFHYRFMEQEEKRKWQVKQQEALESILNLIQLKAPLAEMGGWAASPDFMRVIAQYIIKNKPKTIVECGSGVSTVLMAYFLEKNKTGRLLSLENAPEFAEKTRQEIAIHQLDNFVDVIDAPLIGIPYKEKVQKWYNIEGLDFGTIDLLVVDGPRGDRYPALSFLKQYMNEQTIVIVDDCKREKDTNTIKKWVELYDLNVQWLDTEKGTAVLRF